MGLVSPSSSLLFCTTFLTLRSIRSVVIQLHTPLQVGSAYIDRMRYFFSLRTGCHTHEENALIHYTTLHYIHATHGGLSCLICDDILGKEILWARMSLNKIFSSFSSLVGD
ncbi:uncharacterized protein F4822DRAFT_401285 [Hypoxylon trugodes]|uniref:uncharacterized protein n=1 Tax=Hypoxylon trugodes TaxID=326681 RepID=UPI00219D15F8|nr:uncharacterized protein F4822DRAFT_401285 [Hypoxylon trugodes]KAI1390224.1 hypothetical protein F4822DRAFT_401285 [Hypoxylon trugodes]